MAGILTAFLGNPGASIAGPVVEQALSLPDNFSLDITHRTRYETLANQFRAGHSGGDQAISLYTSVLGTYRGSSYRLVGELIDARAYLDDTGSSIDANTVDAVEPAQLYLGLDLDQLIDPIAKTGAKVDWMVGRFAYTMGAGRLIGRNKFRNMPNMFAGTKLEIATTPDQGLVAFWLMPQIRRPSDLAAVLENEIQIDQQNLHSQLYGAQWYTGIPSGDRLEVFGYRQVESDDGLRIQTRDVRQNLLGLRLLRKPAPGHFDFDVEGGVQWGKAHATTRQSDARMLDVWAQYAYAQFGYAFETAFPVRLSLQYDYGSGDQDPNDNTLQAFDGRYGPVRGDLGPTALFTHVVRTNVHAPGINLATQPTPRLNTFTGVKGVWLASRRAPMGITGVVDPSGQSGRYVGTQLETYLDYVLVPEHVTFETGIAVMFNGEFMNNAPNATGLGDPKYGWASVTFAY